MIPSFGSRLPTSIELLRKICYSIFVICFSDYESLLFRVAFVNVFLSAFCISELLPKNVRDDSFSDLILGEGFVQIRIHRSKMDHLCHGHWITLHQLSSSSICPFSLLRQFLLVCPAFDGRLLIHLSGLPLRRYQFCSVCNIWV